MQPDNTEASPQEAYGYELNGSQYTQHQTGSCTSCWPKATSYGSLHYEAICFQQTSLLHGDPQGHYAALHVEQDEKKNKKRKRKILKKKRKTKRLPRAVDDSARGQRPRKRRPKAQESAQSVWPHQICTQLQVVLERSHSSSLRSIIGQRTNLISSDGIAIEVFNLACSCMQTALAHLGCASSSSLVPRHSRQRCALTETNQ